MGAMTEESPDALNSPEHYARAERSFVGESNPWPPEPTFQPDIFGIPTPPEKILPRRVPHLGHAVLFIVIALVLLSLIQLAGVLALQFSHLFPHQTFQWLFHKSATNARLSIPIQAIAYGVIALVCIP